MTLTSRLETVCKAMEACISASHWEVDEFTCNDICMADRYYQEVVQKRV